MCVISEVTAEMLPALSKVSYDTGILKELLYVDMPSEHQTVSGEIVVHYDKATAELVYQNLRIVHDGHLCIVFTPDLKVRLTNLIVIYLWQNFAAACRLKLLQFDVLDLFVGLLHSQN